MRTVKEPFLLAALLLALVVAGQCVQTAPTEAAQNVLEAKPLCDPDLIDGAFTFSNLPAGQQTISLHFQNKGNVACRLKGQAGPSFGVDGHSMNVASCWLCDQNSILPPVLERRPENQILLAPGERAVVDLYWASTGVSCQWADDVDFFFSSWAKPTGYLFVPSNWPLHICSAVKSGGYRPEGNPPSGGDVKEGLLRVSVIPPVIYSDERATLHVELASSQKTGVASSEEGCANLYAVRHGPSIGTRFQPLVTTGLSSRPSYTPEQIQEDKERAWPSWKRDRLRRCDIAGGQRTADASISAEDLANLTRVEWRTVSAPGEDSVFLEATTHFSVLDVDTLAPNWGEPVKGIRAGLSIDRASFRRGEEIPLHLRWENLNAAKPLGQGECREPEPELEIQDAQHNVVQTIPMLPMCMGHGWGPFMIEKGKAQRTFIALATAQPFSNTASPFSNNVRGNLPGAGVYYLVSVWSPPVLDAIEGETDKSPRIGRGRFGKVYATARSLPVRVEVVPNSNP